MAKSTTVKKSQKQAMVPEYDYSDEISDFVLGSEDETVLEMMAALFEAYRQQQDTAMALTKLVVESNKGTATQEAEIFATFKRALQVVAETSPMKELLQQLKEPHKLCS